MRRLLSVMVLVAAGLAAGSFTHAAPGELSLQSNVDVSGIMCVESPMEKPLFEMSGTCYTCSKSSTDACAPQSGKSRMQCEGDRSECKKKGCKITSSQSCSSAGNVGSC